MASADAGSAKTAVADAFVFFGATGDLAYKKIFPALQGMVRRGNLNCPVVGVAKSGWTVQQLRERARASLTEHGGVDEAAFEKLSSLLAYIDRRLRQPRHVRRPAQGARQREEPDPLPRHPSQPLRRRDRGARRLGLRRGGARRDREALRTRCRERARVERHAALGVPGGLRLSHRSLSRQGSGREPALLPLREHVSGADLEPQLRRLRADHHGRELRDPGPGKFYDETGAIRDVIQNHLLQVVGYLAMEPPISVDADRVRDEQVKVFRAIPPLQPSDVVRGQFKGYLKEPGVAPGSQVETFAAVRLSVNSWRWAGVPFFIRAGKSLPVTATEVMVDLKRPPLGRLSPKESNFFRIPPGAADRDLALGARQEAGPGDRRRCRPSWRSSRTPRQTRSTRTNGC